MDASERICTHCGGKDGSLTQFRNPGQRGKHEAEHMHVHYCIEHMKKEIAKMRVVFQDFQELFGETTDSNEGSATIEVTDDAA